MLYFYILNSFILSQTSVLGTWSQTRDWIIEFVDTYQLLRQSAVSLPKPLLSSCLLTTLFHPPPPLLLLHYCKHPPSISLFQHILRVTVTGFFHRHINLYTFFWLRWNDKMLKTELAQKTFILWKSVKYLMKSNLAWK